jgi:hypothetical protein
LAFLHYNIKIVRPFSKEEEEEEEEEEEGKALYVVCSYYIHIFFF